MIGLYEAVQARLEDRSKCPSVLQVATGMDAQAAAETLALGADVTALITPLSDEARPIAETSFQVTQVTTLMFAVTMAMVFPGGFPQFEPARAEIIAALRGWLPAGAATSVEYAGGSTLQYSVNQDGGRWLHLLRFRLTFQETYEAQS